MGTYTLSIFLALVVFLTFFKNSGADEDQDDWFKSLYFSNDKTNLAGAVKKCADRKMRLVIVDEQYKHDAIKNRLKKERYNLQYYMGGGRITKDGLKAFNVEFRWLNGERLGLRHFGKGRPDNTLQFETQPRSQLSLHYDGKELFWWDSNINKQFKYICEPPRKNYVKGPPDPENSFMIDFTHKRTKGFDKSVKECKSKFDKFIIGLKNETIKNSFLDILIKNDDRQPYYINAKRKDGKSPYMCFNTFEEADTKNWGSGKPSENDNEKCAIVWYDPTSQELKWASAKCDELHFIACQGKESKSGKSGGAGASGGAEASGVAGASKGSGTSNSARASGSTGTSGGAGSSGGAEASGVADTSGGAGASGLSGDGKVSGGSKVSSNAGASSGTGASGDAGGSGASGSIKVSGNAGASSGAGASGRAGASGGAGASDGAMVSGGSGASGGGKVSGGAGTSGDPGTSGGAKVSGDVGASGGAGDSGGDKVSGGAKVSGGTRESGCKEASGGAGTSGSAGASGGAGAAGSAGEGGSTGGGASVGSDG